MSSSNGRQEYGVLSCFIQADSPSTKIDVADPSGNVRTLVGSGTVYDGDCVLPPLAPDLITSTFDAMLISAGYKWSGQTVTPKLTSATGIPLPGYSTMFVPYHREDGIWVVDDPSTSMSWPSITTYAANGTTPTGVAWRALSIEILQFEYGQSPGHFFTVNTKRTVFITGVSNNTAEPWTWSPGIQAWTCVPYVYQG